MDKNNSILLIDGSSFIFRAFHAIPNLTSPDGKPTNATYGVVNMLKQLQKKYTTTHWACVFDIPGKTFRDELYPLYKSTRSATPSELISQLKDIYTIVAALGIPVIMQTGIEADDIIGTIAIKAKLSGKKIFIATGDKDFAQLVDEDITLINTMNNEVLDVAGVIAKFGVQPKQIIDYLSLIGDKVDNIPGVEKCGPKTAVKWLTQYTNIENLLKNIDEITGVVGNNLRLAINWLPTAQTLVKIDTNIAIDHINIHDINNLICQTPQIDILKSYYTKLGFKTWLKQLDATTSNHENKIVNTKNYTPKDMITITNTLELEQLINQLIKNNNPTAVLAIPDDLHKPNYLKFVALSTSKLVYIIHNQITTSQDLFAQASMVKHNNTSLLTQFFESNIAKVIPNAKETLQLFAVLKLPLNNICGDITLAHYLKNSKQKHTMSAIFDEYLNLKVIDLPSFQGKLLKNSLWLSNCYEEQIDNCYKIIQYTLELEINISAQLTSRELDLYKNIELPLAKVLVDIESSGIMLDNNKFVCLEHELKNKLTILENHIYSEAKCVFNINSTKQLQDVLFKQLCLPTNGIKKNTNGYSTDEDTLSTLSNQGITIAVYMLEYRTLNKLLNTYVAKLPLATDNNHRVHTTFEQALVASGRLSSRDPNLQNIPIKSHWGKRIRQCFISKIGHKLVCVDYSQIELRILAVLSNDENLINAFNNNQDIHSITASEIFHKNIANISKDERRYAKTINFSLIYGKTVFGLAQELNLDMSTAKLYIDTYFAKYPKIKQCLEEIKDFARHHGYIETIFGRRIYLPNINAPNKIVREAEERLALNAPMQGTSADIIKKSMLNINKWLQDNKLQSKMVLQIHDELIFEVPDNEVALIKANLSDLMTNNITLAVKMAVEVKVATNWDEAH